MDKMMLNITNNERLRSYASLFSASFFSRLLESNDPSLINCEIITYDKSLINKAFKTYMDYLIYAYNILVFNYRNEYIVKNTLINELLLKKYSTKNTVAFSEFKVGSSIADFVLFNGVSKVFEIKTELDSERRLESQLKNYMKLFQECYVVIPAESIPKYLVSLAQGVGVISVVKSSNKMILKEILKPTPVETIDCDVLMESVKTAEYKNIVSNYCGHLPEMNSFNMYNVCKEIIRCMPAKELRILFNNEMKKRQTNTALLYRFKKELRQLCLSMNVGIQQYNGLILRLKEHINL